MIFSCTDAFVTLASVDLEKLIQFYTQLFGQEPQPYIPDVYAEFHLPGLRLGIFKPRETDRYEFESKGEKSSVTQPGNNLIERNCSMSLCLEVSDLEVAIAHLTAIGYPPPGEIITASHGREIYAYDPAGNRLIFHQSH